MARSPSKFPNSVIRAKLKAVELPRKISFRKYCMAAINYSVKNDGYATCMNDNKWHSSRIKKHGKIRRIKPLHRDQYMMFGSLTEEE